MKISSISTEENHRFGKKYNVMCCLFLSYILFPTLHPWHPFVAPRGGPDLRMAANALDSRTEMTKLSRGLSLFSWLYLSRVSWLLKSVVMVFTSAKGRQTIS